MSEFPQQSCRTWRSWKGSVGSGKVGNICRTSLEPQMHGSLVKHPCKLKILPFPYLCYSCCRIADSPLKTSMLLIWFLTTAAWLGLITTSDSSNYLLILHGNRLSYGTVPSTLHEVQSEASWGREGGRYFQLSSEKNAYMHKLNSFSANEFLLDKRSVHKMKRQI